MDIASRNHHLEEDEASGTDEILLLYYRFLDVELGLEYLKAKCTRGLDESLSRGDETKHCVHILAVSIATA